MIKKAFTLIELLVVIAIIGSLTALLVPNLMAVREKARDAQRKSDLKQIQKVLELYKEDQTPITYPTSLPSPGGVAWTGSNGNVYINHVPYDPGSVTPTGYCYKINNIDNLKYTLCAKLENVADTEGITCSTSGCPSYCGALVSPIKCILLSEP